MQTGFRAFLAVGAAIAAWGGVSVTPARAAQPGPEASYPERPVRLVVPFSPGGGTDVAARAIAMELTEQWKQQVIVDNRAGGSGSIGVDIVAKATPDGYTLCMITGSQTVDAATNPKLPYDLTRDLSAISRLTSSFYLLNAHSSLPVKSLPELIAYAKAHPGKLNFGSSGLGSLAHLSGELLAHLAKVKLTHIPYKGGSATGAALASGEIQLAFLSPPASRPFLSAGRVRALAVTGSKRSPEYPQLPAMSEHVRGYEVDQWYAVLAPRGVDSRLLKKLSTDFNDAVRSDRVRKVLTPTGVMPVGSTPVEAANHIKSEIAKWRSMVQAAGLVLR